MCDPSLLMVGGLAEQLGDPLGTRKRREDAAASDQQNRWAREDSIRDATWAHEKEMAGMTNRSQLGTGTTGTAKSGGTTGTPKASRGGGRSSGNQAY